MDDLLVTLNVSSTVGSGVLILQTYYADVKVNRYGKYVGGRIMEADAVMCEPVRNCGHMEIRRLFRERCVRLSASQYYIEEKNFQYLADRLGEKQLLFLDNKDKTLFLIRQLRQKAGAGKHKYRYQGEGLTLTYDADNTLTLETDPDRRKEVCCPEPIPGLLPTEERSIYALIFEYGAEKVLPGEKRVVISDGAGKRLLLRNYEFEVRIGDVLREHGFQKLAKNRYRYGGRARQDELPGLLRPLGIGVNAGKRGLLPKVRVKQSESGWFDFELNYTIDGAAIDLAEKIDLFSREGTLEYGTEELVLPESLLEVREQLVLKDGRLKLDRRHILSVLRVLCESHASVSEAFDLREVPLLLDERLDRTLYPYQRDGVRWLKFLRRNHLGGCLADDMGLGKTLQVIAFLNEQEVRRGLRKVLIVVPRSLLTNWKKEFDRFSTGWKVGIYHGSDRSAAVLDKLDVVLSTYQTVRMDLEELNRFRYSVVVFDEIQLIKNHKGLTSEAMKKLNSEMRIGLSGTPMENNISELWNIMDILDHGLLPGLTAFVRRYHNRNYDELRTILSLFILRRMKTEVLKELPPKYEEIVYCDMAPAQRRMYDGLRCALLKEIRQLKAFCAPLVLKGLTLLRECCCHPGLLDEGVNPDGIDESCKLETLLLLVGDLTASGHKILIFSQYTRMLHLIREALDGVGTAVYYLDGTTEDRDGVVTAFEAAEEGIFLISIKAGGTGLNLVSAQDVILYDPWWNPFVEQQAVDRTYRIGQDKAVHVYRLIAADTLEERIVDMQREKQRDFDEIINGTAKLEKRDLEKVLRLLE